MSKKKDNVEADPYAYLLKPAKDLTDNFSIDLLQYLNGYLELIRHRDEESDSQFDVASNYQAFNFTQACMVLQSSALVYSRKVDYIAEEVYNLLNILENAKGDDAVGSSGPRKGRRRKMDLGSSSYDLLDMKNVRTDILKQINKFEKEEKIAIDNLRLIDNAEIAELQYERKSVTAVKPSQFMFGRSCDQFMRTNEQVLNAKPRAEVIGKVRDFYLKKSDVFHQYEMLIIHDTYAKNIAEFTLPGARWIPDNKELAANFGVADIEIELDMERRNDCVSVFGPFKDPLSGRDIVAPPKWYIEKEAEKQQRESLSRLSSAPIRDSQGFGQMSQPTRMSQPLVERGRNSLNQFVSFVEGRLNKNKHVTNLNTGLVDMFVNNFGDNLSFNNENEMEYGGCDDEEEDYVEGLKRDQRKRDLVPWDDLESDPMRGLLYHGDEEVHFSNKDIKLISNDPTSSVEIMNKQLKKDRKMGMTRQDDFMQTHDYLQYNYYWRSAARINPNKDWKIEALRMTILKEQKRRAKERTQKIRNERVKRNATNIVRRRGTRMTVEELEEDRVVDEGNSEQVKSDNVRRTLGAEYDDVADEDLAAEIELSMLGGGFDDDDEIVPEANIVPDIGSLGANSVAPAETQGLTFNAIDDAELANIFNLPNDLFIDRALPLLKNFAENRTERDKMAYEMAKAYETVDVATSRLQAQVDEWHAMIEPALEEGETRKDYDVHAYGTRILEHFKEEGETKTFEELCVGKPWYEISRYFLSCLLMCNTHNVLVTEDKTKDLSDRMNTMTVSLVTKKRHHEVFEQDGAL